MKVDYPLEVFIPPYFIGTLAASTDNGQVGLWKRELDTSGVSWSHVTTFNADGQVRAIEVIFFSLEAFL